MRPKGGGKTVVFPCRRAVSEANVENRGLPICLRAAQLQIAVPLGCSQKIKENGQCCFLLSIGWDSVVVDEVLGDVGKRSREGRGGEVGGVRLHHVQKDDKFGVVRREVAEK